MKDNTNLRRIHAGLLCGCPSIWLLGNLLDFGNMLWLKIIFIVLGVVAAVALILVSVKLINESGKQDNSDSEKEK